MEQIEKKEMMMDISSDTVANLQDNRTEISQEEYDVHLKEKVSGVGAPIKDKVSAQIEALEKRLSMARKDKYDKEEEIAALTIQIIELEKQNIGKSMPRYFKSKDSDFPFVAIYKTKSTKGLPSNGFALADMVAISYNKSMDINKVEFRIDTCLYTDSCPFRERYAEITEAEYNSIKKKAMDAIAK